MSLGRERLPWAKRRPEWDRGQALVEFALILPIIFILVVNTVNFGAFIFAWLSVQHASRNAVQYAVLGSEAMGHPLAPTGSQVQTLVNSDFYSLLKGTNPTVTICSNTNGNITNEYGSGCNPPADPEPASFTLLSVDVNYTYTPIIPSFSIAELGIITTLPPTTIHRTARMRLLQ